MKNRDLKRILSRRGWQVRPGRGDHVIWTHPDHPTWRAVLTGGDHDDAHLYQVARACRPQKHTETQEHRNAKTASPLTRRGD